MIGSFVGCLAALKIVCIANISWSNIAICTVGYLFLKFVGRLLRCAIEQEL